MQIFPQLNQLYNIQKGIFMQFLQLAEEKNRKSTYTLRQGSHIRQKSEGISSTNKVLNFIETKKTQNMSKKRHPNHTGSNASEIIKQTKPKVQSTNKSFNLVKKDQEIQQFKVGLKNMLMKMKEREKLDYIQSLVHEAKNLCQSFGHFYLTCAMIVFKPANKIKLSLWVHPNLHQTKPLHPILLTKQAEREREFYQSLKHVLRQLFPTISLGNHSCYKSICCRILLLKNKQVERSSYSSSGRTSQEQYFKEGSNGSMILKKYPNKCSKKSQIVSKTQQRGHKTEGKYSSDIYYSENKKNYESPRKKTAKSSKKTEVSEFSLENFSEPCLHFHNKLSESFHDDVNNLFEDHGQDGDDQFTLYEQKSDLNCTRNRIIEEVREQIEQLLFQ